jgi:galactoside O-acetyltransferase
MPNITVGKGSVIGAASFVNKNVEPWGIYVGSPARKIGVREK